MLVVQALGNYGFYALAGRFYLVTMLLAQMTRRPGHGAGDVADRHSSRDRKPCLTRNIGIIVAMACSASFLTPFAHPVNLLMVGPAGYQFRDFVRLGAGLAVICLIVSLAGAFLLPGG